MAERKHSYASRRVWTRPETRTLLCFAIQRKHEFDHVVKKKNVYLNLLEDLTNSFESAEPFTELEIRNKLRNLKTAYKSAIDNNAKTGASYTVEPYKDLLQQLYDKEAPPELSKFKSVSSGIAGSTVPISGHSSVNEPSTSTSNSSTVMEGPPITSQSDTNLSFDDLIEVSLPETDTVITSKPPKRRRPVKKSYKQLKLEFLKEKEKAKQERERNKQKRHEENLETQNRIHEDRKKWHEDLINVLKQK